jgi:dTDP-4-dehydrorhamnose reductase
LKSILVIGKNGQVGSELSHALRASGDVTALGRTELDLTNPDALRAIIRAAKPDVIVNAAAYTAVDKAESEPDLAMQINAIAPGIMAEEALRLGALLVHYSTDYVFDGAKPTAYTESDTPNPLNVYGRTKLAGEQAIQTTGVAHYILRSSWVYAAEGANFLNTILRLARERPELRIVNDQTGAPTWGRAIAELTAQILSIRLRDDADPRYGLYHLTASGAVTWFGFAQAILAEAQKTPGLATPRLIPITTAEYPLPARRPANSRLDCTKLEALLATRLPSWQDGLAQCLREKSSPEAGIHCP